MNELPLLDHNAVKDRERYPERIVQFGAGNFLRAFVDYFIDILNEEAGFASSVVVVKATSGTYTTLDNQDGLFHVHIEGVENTGHISQNRLVSCISRTVYPYQDFTDFLELARQHEIRFIVSNTTEAGIVYNADDQQTDTPPESFPAKLTLFLYERFKHFSGSAQKGCIILPTELIENNGSQLQQIILRYAEQWQLDAGFPDWLVMHNLFCNTLVDRIVSGFPEQQKDAYFAEIGYQDDLLVVGEPYHSWVIEAPDHLKDELPIDKTTLNIQIVSDVAPYRETKVRILNGLHTSMVFVGLLFNLRAVRDCVEHDLLAQFLMDEVYQEIIPSMALAENALIEFAKATFDRFRNPSIDHQLLSIATNSSSKVKTRILPTLLAYYSKTGQIPKRIALVIAAYMQVYKGEWQGETIPLNDDVRIVEKFKSYWHRYASVGELVKAILADVEIWGQDLSGIAGFDALLTDYVTQINTSGIRDIVSGLTDAE